MPAGALNTTKHCSLSNTTASYILMYTTHAEFNCDMCCFEWNLQKCSPLQATHLTSFTMLIITTSYILLLQHGDMMHREQPRLQSSWGQHGAHLGPVCPRWAPWWPQEPCYQVMQPFRWWRNWNHSWKVMSGLHISSFNILPQAPDISGLHMAIHGKL